MMLLATLLFSLSFAQEANTPAHSTYVLLIEGRDERKEEGDFIQNSFVEMGVPPENFIRILFDKPEAIPKALEALAEKTQNEKSPRVYAFLHAHGGAIKPILGDPIFLFGMKKDVAQDALRFEG